MNGLKAIFFMSLPGDPLLWHFSGICVVYGADTENKPFPRIFFFSSLLHAQSLLRSHFGLRFFLGWKGGGEHVSVE